jgi:hypothetical protein
MLESVSPWRCIGVCAADGFRRQGYLLGLRCLVCDAGVTDENVVVLCHWHAGDVDAAKDEIPN